MIELKGFEMTKDDELLDGNNSVAPFTLFGGTFSNKGANDDAQQTGDCVKSTLIGD